MHNYFCNIRTQSWCFICCKHVFKKVITNWISPASVSDNAAILDAILDFSARTNFRQCIPLVSQTTDYKVHFGICHGLLYFYEHPIFILALKVTLLLSLLCSFVFLEAIWEATGLAWDAPLVESDILEDCLLLESDNYFSLLKLFDIRSSNNCDWFPCSSILASGSIVVLLCAVMFANNDWLRFSQVLVFVGLFVNCSFDVFELLSCADWFVLFGGTSIVTVDGGTAVSFIWILLRGDIIRIWFQRQYLFSKIICLRQHVQVVLFYCFDSTIIDKGVKVFNVFQCGIYLLFKSIVSRWTSQFVLLQAFLDFVLKF